MTGAKHFPGRPTPEIDIEILQVLSMRANAPLRRRPPAVEKCSELPACARLDPAAAPFSLFLLRRIADDDRDRLLFLHRVGVASRLCHWLHDLRQPFLLDERVAQRVRDEKAKIGDCGRWVLGGFHQRLHLGDQAKLCDRKWAELKLKSDHALRSRLDRAAHGTLTLI